MQIIPTIFEKEFNKVEPKLEAIKNLSKWVQIDVTDGIFSYGKTFNLELLSKTKVDINDILLDIHLMVKDPIKWIEKCLFVGATRIIGQVEMMSDRNDFVEKVIMEGVDVGLAFDIDTEIDQIPEETNLVLLMARKSGFGHYSLNQKIWGKIEQLKKLKQEKKLKFEIGIDGAVNLENIQKFKEVGIDIVYCGGAIFNGNTKANFEELSLNISDKK